MAWTVIVNDLPSDEATPEELRQRIEQEDPQYLLDVWLERDDDDGVDHGTMALEASGDCAWLVHFRHRDGDSGFSSRNPAYDGPADAMLPFRIGGQASEHPVAWTIARGAAIGVLEHFMTTGERAPWVVWHED